MNLDDILKSTGERTETKIEHMCPFMKGFPPPKQNTPHFRNSDEVTGNMQGIERRSKNRSPHTKTKRFSAKFCFLESFNSGLKNPKITKTRTLGKTQRLRFQLSQNHRSTDSRV
jgi:hypothetical protein